MVFLLQQPERTKTRTTYVVDCIIVQNAYDPSSRARPESLWGTVYPCLAESGKDQETHSPALTVRASRGSTGFSLRGRDHDVQTETVS